MDPLFLLVAWFIGYPISARLIYEVLHRLEGDDSRSSCGALALIWPVIIPAAVVVALFAGIIKLVVPVR